MMMDESCAAVRSRKCIRIDYDGHERIVEPHAAGYSRAGNAVMRVYQVDGGSKSGEGIGWKMLRLDEIFSFTILPEDSSAPRPGYKRGDRGMDRVEEEI